MIFKTQIFFSYLVNQRQPGYQKQSPVGALSKMSSQNKEQIHRRTPTPMFVSNKAAVQLDWKHTLVGCRNGHTSTEDTLTWTTAGLASGLYKHFNNEKV